MRRISRELDRAFFGSILLCFLLTSAPALLGARVLGSKVLRTSLTTGFLLCLIQILTLLWLIGRYERRSVQRLEPLGRRALAESQVTGHASRNATRRPPGPEGT